MKKSRTTNKTMHERILESSIPLFAATGYEGVSMRDVAVAVKLTPAALYYHFPNKEQLYVEAVTHAFREVTGVLKAAIESVSTPLEKLESTIRATTQMFAGNKPLIRLIQWVKLDNKKQRRKELASSALSELYSAVTTLVEGVGCRHYNSLIAVSIVSLVMFPFEVDDTLRVLPDYAPHSTDPKILTDHVMRVLRHGLTSYSGSSAPLTSFDGDG
jgi:AcrR family transcriptional regulator